ncbi:ribosomal protection-like ABC-F family protein [Ruminococcus gauvreauii]|uniref:ribosomal protection-like ABC-F family protein n=1 Tax=Ruminococcus gauvreauii TaxID=438033 RepID=UPI00398418BE
MSLLQVTDLSFSYEENYDPVFQNVSFRVDTDWRTGVVGRNGKGKTTFLKLLMGEMEYSGSITADAGFDYFPYPVAERQLDTIDAMYCVEPGLLLWKLKKDMAELGADEGILYRPFDTLSCGEQTKVMLAVLFQREGNFLLIDEPTNHLDQESRILVSAYLRRQKGFLMVSHDRAFLDGCIDHVLAFNRSDIEVQKGDFSSWYQNRQMQDAFELAKNERLKKDIRRLSAAADRTKRWGDAVESTKIGRKSMENGQHAASRDYIGEKSRRMQQRRKNLARRQEQALQETKMLLKNQEDPDILRMEPLPYHKEVLVLAEDLCLCYGNREVLSGVNFAVRRGDRMSVQGKNGCGKSSILKLILGEQITYRGELMVGRGIKISYVSQDTSHLRGSLTEYIRDSGMEERLFKAVLRKLDFSRTQFEKDMESYSEGQKKKVLIARSLCERAHLYIWDEPLNFIDVYSRMQIEELLLMWKPTLLFVEHDAVFTEKIATSVCRI